MIVFSSVRSFALIHQTPHKRNSSYSETWRKTSHWRTREEGTGFKIGIKVWYYVLLQLFSSISFYNIQVA